MVVPDPYGTVTQRIIGDILKIVRLSQCSRAGLLKGSLRNTISLRYLEESNATFNTFDSR